MEIPVGQKCGRRTKMLICYLCGREYGTKSLQIHIPQCQKKWLVEESKKPKKEQRPMPQPPNSDIPNKNGNMDAFNDEAYACWESTLEKCPYCNRKFQPEAFKHHQKGCTANNPAKKAGTGLTTFSLSNRLLPSSISGTRRGSKAGSEGNLIGCTSLGPKANANSGRLQRNPDIMLQSLKSKGHDRRSTSAGGFRPNVSHYCDNCGKKYPRIESKFCSNCGTRRPGI